MGGCESPHNGKWPKQPQTPGQQTLHQKEGPPPVTMSLRLFLPHGSHNPAGDDPSAYPPTGRRPPPTTSCPHTADTRRRYPSPPGRPRPYSRPNDYHSEASNGLRRPPTAANGLQRPSTSFPRSQRLRWSADPRPLLPRPTSPAPLESADLGMAEDCRRPSKGLTELLKR